MINNQILKFTNWYIDSKEGNGSNYIKNYFNNEIETFRLNVKDYAVQYAISYGHNPFEIDTNKIPELINKIEKNLYSSKSSSSFMEYSIRSNNHLPKAILGKKNYLNYLSIINVIKATQHTGNKAFSPRHLCRRAIKNKGNTSCVLAVLALVFMSLTPPPPLFRSPVAFLGTPPHIHLPSLQCLSPLIVVLACWSLRANQSVIFFAILPMCTLPLRFSHNPTHGP